MGTSRVGGAIVTRGPGRFHLGRRASGRTGPGRCGGVSREDTPGGGEVTTRIARFSVWRTVRAWIVAFHLVTEEYKVNWSRR